MGDWSHTRIEIIGESQLIQKASNEMELSENMSGDNNNIWYFSMKYSSPHAEIIEVSKKFPSLEFRAVIDGHEFENGAVHFHSYNNGRYKVYEVQEETLRKTYSLWDRGRNDYLEALGEILSHKIAASPKRRTLFSSIANAWERTFSKKEFNNSQNINTMSTDEQQDQSTQQDGQTSKKPINSQYLRGNLADVPKVLDSGKVAVTLIVGTKDEKNNPESFSVIFYGDGAEKAKELEKGAYIDLYGKVSVKVNSTDKGRYENETIAAGGFKRPETWQDGMEKEVNLRAFSGRLAKDPEFFPYNGTGKNGESEAREMVKYTLIQNEMFGTKEEPKEKKVAMSFIAFGKDKDAIKEAGLAQGDLVLAKGSAKTNNFTNDEGKQFISRTMIQSEVKLLFKKSQDQEVSEEAEKKNSSGVKM